MNRFFAAFCAIALPALALAQQSSPAPADDLHLLRQLVEQQSRQIEALTQQITRLAQVLENNRTAAASPAPAQNMPPVQESAPAPSPADAPHAEAVATESEAAHTVAKGETLISIAKHYKVSVAELLKINKIEDERKLQIGQTLTIPNSKPAESPKQNKL